MSPREPFPRCHAIVLAAGGARRFQGSKLLATFRSRPLICHAVDAALNAPVETVTAVLGADANAMKRALADVDDPRLRTVRCANWHDGIAASLKCGVASLPPDCRGILLFLGDMPNVDRGQSPLLLQAVLDGALAALPEYEGTPGHPVAIAPTLFPLLAELEGDRGARALIKATTGVVYVPTDNPGCIEDIDTRAD